MKIGIFGGCFNPPHNMHKKIALELIQKKYLDKVIYVPTGDEYEKDDLIKGIHRYKMLCLMTKDNSNLLVSDYEVKNKCSYTYQTLSYFKKKYSDSEIYFICGSDNLVDFTTWNNYQYILDCYKILVIKRDEEEIDEMILNNKNVIEASIPMSNLSSTKIRNLINDGRSEELLTKLDDTVIEYIEKNKLYG